MKTTEAKLRAAGICPPPRPTSPVLPPGTLVVEFEVPARPIPWKVASTTRTGHSYKDKKLVAWQAEVARCAAMAMRGRAPYGGAVRVEMEFYLTPRPGVPGDASNFGKATEDALQGTVILNDRKVVDVRSRRYLQHLLDMARVTVYAAEEQ
jgi:Holliday junction resolvase RusA-like endonuclease